MNFENKDKLDANKSSATAGNNLGLMNPDIFEPAHDQDTRPTPLPPEESPKVVPSDKEIIKPSVGEKLSKYRLVHFRDEEGKQFAVVHTDGLGYEFTSIDGSWTHFVSEEAAKNFIFQLDAELTFGDNDRKIKVVNIINQYNR